MKTKSGIYVDVTERPGEIVVSLRVSAQEDRSSIAALATIITGAALKLPAGEIVAQGLITGHQPGWSISLKPLGAKRVADGLKPIHGILTGEETRTLRGLLKDARRWAENPPMLTYVDGTALQAALRELGDRINNHGGHTIKISGAVVQLANRLRGYGQMMRSRVTRQSLAALRAAPTASPETDASPEDPNLRWARQPLWQTEVRSPEVWEPCRPLDEGARLVVLP